MSTEFPYRKEDSRLFGVICRPVVGFEDKQKYHAQKRENDTE